MNVQTRALNQTQVTITLSRAESEDLQGALQGISSNKLARQLQMALALAPEHDEDLDDD